jgi:hypothetical protein
MSIIRDGTGSGDAAKVNSDNKLETVAISTDVQQNASLDRRLFRISSPVLTLTGTGNSSILYVRNDDPNNNLIVPALIVSVGGSTGASADALVTGIGRANITGGTIVSSAQAASLIPLNLNVTTAPAITVYYGGEGFTSTYPLDIPSYQGYHQNVNDILPFFITVNPGNNFVISFTPPAGNTSLDVQVSVRAYLEPISQ